MLSPDWIEKCYDWDEPMPWYKKTFIKLVVNPMDIIHSWWYWKVTDKLRNFKNAKMRVTHGYDYNDVWNMNSWFVNGAVPILEHWIENGKSWPGRGTDELSVDSPEEWNKILQEMLDGFKLYKQAHVDGGIPLPEEKWKTYSMFSGQLTGVIDSRYNLTKKEDEKLKRSLFLFSKYFYTLWD